MKRSASAPRLPLSSCVTSAIARALPPRRSAVSRSTRRFCASSQLAGARRPPSRTSGPGNRSGW
ncbi:MAG: hypothetical protein A2W08_15500 [Candidatus Rokubacteria bacterium RBG_16_73_20]|nr:MAG: hypothetical protein A2W08_15500 [Candidatus Rokubacteria bacterium RBG_16_73_20]